MSELEQKIQWYTMRIAKEKAKFERLSYKLGVMREKLQILFNKQYLAEQAKALAEMTVSKGEPCSKS